LLDLAEPRMLTDLASGIRTLFCPRQILLYISLWEPRFLVSSV
jgi:hypothetical protein